MEVRFCISIFVIAVIFLAYRTTFGLHDHDSSGVTTSIGNSIPIPKVQLQQQNSKAKLEIFYDTCCPATELWFTEYFFKDWYYNGTNSSIASHFNASNPLTNVTTLFMNNVDLSVIPEFDNATWNKDLGQYTFNCSHGIDSCKGNMIMACILYETNWDPMIYMPYIFKLESKLWSIYYQVHCPSNITNIAKEIILELDLFSWEHIDTCMKNGDSNVYSYELYRYSCQDVVSCPTFCTPEMTIDNQLVNCTKSDCYDLVTCVCNTVHQLNQTNEMCQSS